MNDGEIEARVAPALAQVCDEISNMGTREIRERTLLLRDEFATEDDAIDGEWDVDEQIFAELGDDPTEWLADLCTGALEGLGFRWIDGGSYFEEWHRQLVRLAKAEVLGLVTTHRPDGDVVSALLGPMNLLLGREPQSHALGQLRPIERVVSPRIPTFRVNAVVDAAGRAIGSADREAWLEARRQGITATDARRLVRKNGIPSLQQNALLQDKLWGESDFESAAMRYGSEREATIASWIQERFAIDPNRLLLHGENPRHLATPDGLGVGTVAEIKTSTIAFDRCAKRYSDQVQWQLHVVGAVRALFVVEHRDTLERQAIWIERDEARIQALAQNADRFLERLDEARASTTRAPEHAVARVPVQPSVHRRPVYFRDESSLSPDESERWNPVESDRLESLYREGHEIENLSAHFDQTSRSVVFELSARLLVTEGDLVDQTAVRFGEVWTDIERSSVANLYREGESILSIARLLGRDQLAIAFVLFRERLVASPPAD